jgi:hypothetical protein
MRSKEERVMSAATPLADALAQGREVRKCGCELEENPYEGLSACSLAWAVGWSIERESQDRVVERERPRRAGCKFPHCRCNDPWSVCDLSYDGPEKFR